MSDIVLHYDYLHTPIYYFLLAISKVDQSRTRVSITWKRTTWSKKVPLHYIEMTSNNVTRLNIGLLRTRNRPIYVFYTNLNSLRNLR